MGGQPVVHRTIVLADVEGFGGRSRTDPHRVAVRAGLYRLVEQAFGAAGIAWSDCHREDRGDGILILAPAGAAKGAFVDALPTLLVEGLCEHNSRHDEQGQIRLRIALHAGEIQHDDHGVVGESINLAFRLLDAAPLKSALAESPGVLALIASTWFFDEVVRHSAVADPGSYRQIRVRAKETDAVGWVHLPDHPYPPRETRRAPPAAAVPHQLPAEAAHFVGRDEELRRLVELLDTTDTGTVLISAVSGTAGVGKTALALRWAHRVRWEFPDGQLYVNLRGYDPDQPMAPDDALAGFLRALGVAGPDIPLELEERAAGYRSLLDGRRMLVVLDNAATVEQVRPLLPGAPGCQVVVTSRDSLVGLVVRHGAHRLDLDLLPPEESIALLGALIGTRVAAEPDAAAALAGQCARLPLALRVAAELAAARPAAGLAELVAELSDQQRRLELLDADGDPRTAVRAVFSWSYQHLAADVARAFRLIGLHPGPDLDPYAAAALTDTDLDEARHLLDVLVRAHLVEPTDPGRYGMHDLLRAYATDLAIADDSAEGRSAALTRLFDHYLATAAAAMDALHPAERDRRPRVPPGGTPSPPVTEPAAGRTWLDTERATLVVACAVAASRGWPRHTINLATTLFRYLDSGGHHPEAIAVHTNARRAAQDMGDPAAEGSALGNLGLVHQRQGRYEQAADHYQLALARLREIGDRAGEGRILGNLGVVYWSQGRFEQAADHYRLALARLREIGDRAGEAHSLGNLGLVYERQGRFERAADHYRQVLVVCSEIGDRTGEALALGNLGVVYERQGSFAEAAEHQGVALALFREIGDRVGETLALGNLGVVYERQGSFAEAAEHQGVALTLCCEIGDRAGEARALGNLGVVYERQGRFAEAAEHQRRALALFREIGHQDGEVQTLNEIGEAHQATGQLREAHSHHATALALAAEIGDRYEEARAHNGLAHTHRAAGEFDLARDHWGAALILYTELGLPEADDVRVLLGDGQDVQLDPAQSHPEG